MNLNPCNRPLTAGGPQLLLPQALPLGALRPQRGTLQQGQRLWPGGLQLPRPAPQRARQPARPAAGTCAPVRCMGPGVKF